MVARRAHNPEAAGSSPVPATKIIICRLMSAVFLYIKLKVGRGKIEEAGSKSYLFCAALLQCAIGQQRT